MSRSCKLSSSTHGSLVHKILTQLTQAPGRWHPAEEADSVRKRLKFMRYCFPRNSMLISDELRCQLLKHLRRDAMKLRLL